MTVARGGFARRISFGKSPIKGGGWAFTNSKIYVVDF